MTGKLDSTGRGPAHVAHLTGPLSAIVSPEAKWYTTSTTRYAIEVSAMIEVYLKLSSFRRKDKGITINLSICQYLAAVPISTGKTHMKTVTQNCLSTKY